MGNNIGCSLRSGDGGDQKENALVGERASEKDKMEEIFARYLATQKKRISPLCPRMVFGLMESGSYRWLVLHERDTIWSIPTREMFCIAMWFVKLRSGWNESKEIVEQQALIGQETRHFPVGPAWIPWASQEVQKPIQDMPDRYFMAIFDLYEWKDAKESIE